ncbi:MAG: hypothetical protein IRY95_06910, partial [Clostridia bacterium]|nr:hypothetical protein [Clostridia bacterium]
MRGATLLACCLLLLPVFLAIPAPGPGGRPAAAVQRPAGGDPPLDPGGDLLSAVLAVEAELRRAEALAASLERRLAVLGSERRAASRRREELSRQVAAERRRLRAWLRFLHEHGWVGYTEVLLGAADFADFVRRWNLLARLTEVQVQRLQVLRSVLEEQRREETRLAALADEAAAALAEARQTAARLAALREERARRLEEARRRQAAWVESLPAVLAALRGLRALPWQELRPASVDVRFAPLRAEVVIAEADVRRVTGLDVRFAPAGVALTGRATDGNPFRLTGSLAV